MASVKIRHRFQPRDEVEVDEQEAKVLKEQGLLYEGTDDELAALFAADPVGPLDPPRVYTTTDPAGTQAQPAADKPAKAPAAADKTPPAADTAKGA